MSAFAIEFMGLLGRWVHLVTGIAWIGASFYFVWLDNHLLPPTDEGLIRKGVGGELWAVHGGGFYNAQKYRVAPQVLPQSLHWFYWEAYSTFLSGMFLLCLLYYGQAEIYLIDRRVADLTQLEAIAISLGFIVGGWLLYDTLCRSPLVRRPAWLAAVIALLCGAAAYGLCHLFSGRGAFIQFGAVLGTIMVANVFFVIIPGQRDMVRAKREGREPDSQAGVRGKLRSVHNTYFTLPVLFTMISNHYALAFGARYNWLVLIALCAAGVLIRVYFVNRHKRRLRGGKTSLWPALLGVLVLAATGAALAPHAAPSTSFAAAAPVRFSTVQHIVAERCVPCHAASPTEPGFSSAPKGLLLDSSEAILTHLAVIAPQVQSRAMPIGNLTGMTDAERSQLLDWIRHGAPH
ncbi:MAG TPA: urate hydroxylase PuuD [Steroidobacteraceae bacterium]|nr:urate hydroxylase PuuD [Steroidobacteraceae bacterium]